MDQVRNISIIYCFYSYPGIVKHDVLTFLTKRRLLQLLAVIVDLIQRRQENTRLSFVTTELHQIFLNRITLEKDERLSFEILFANF